MLFSKEIESRCELCLHSKKLNDNETLCPRHGIVSLGYKCRHFKYDATKRIPPENSFSEMLSFDKDDFSLDKE